MNIRQFGEDGFSLSLAGGQKEGREDAAYFFEPSILAQLVSANGLNQGFVRVHPVYGVSIVIQKRKKKENG